MEVGVTVAAAMIWLALDVGIKAGNTAPFPAPVHPPPHPSLLPANFCAN